MTTNEVSRLKKNYFFQFILSFNLFLLLFIDFTIHFSIIHESDYIILVNFYLYLFSKKKFNLNKINEFQTDSKTKVTYQ